jgi:glyoxylase-like metal-dependent hydrolase (beta-lactamase superfamily II)
VGRVRVTPIEETILLFPAETFLPTATKAELEAISWLGEPYVTAEAVLRLIVQAFVVETPETRIIVDTCMGNDKPRRWRAANMLDTDFLPRLATAGYPRETLDVVLCTHLHVDHVGWNTMLEDSRWTPTFPKARYLFARREFEHWEAQRGEHDAAVFEDSVRPVVDAGLATLVELDHVVDPWVRLTPTVGHTPGHVSVQIDDQGERALITGDSFHTPAQIARPDWASIPDYDPAAGTQTRRRILEELADTQTRMFGTHFPTPTVGRIVRDGDSYRFETAED